MRPTPTRSTVDTTVSVAVALVVASAATIGLVVARHGSGEGGRANEDASIGTTSCDLATPTVAGPAEVTVANAGDGPLEVRLLSADRAVVVARVDAVAPGRSRDLAVRLAPGAYVWSCRADDGTDQVSAPWVVEAGADDSARYAPVTAAELDDAVDTYRVEVTAQLDALTADVAALRGAVAGRDLDGARAAWLRAHLDYERMGAAYGTFGDLDGAINGRPTGLPGGVDDPEFTGFRLVEHQLWSTSPVDWEAVAATTAQLGDDVDALAADLPVLFTDPADLPLRAHEILEGSLQFELNGLSDQGSGTELATVRANVEGTRLVLVALASALDQRRPDLLAGVDADLAELATVLETYEGSDGTWTPLDAVALAGRQQLAARVGHLVEELAAVPGLLSLPTASS